MRKHSGFASEDETPQANPLLDQLRRDVQTPGDWPRRFRRLVRASLADDDAEPARLSCDDCRSALDVYTDDELNGLDVRARHPALWQHFQTCRDCERDHALLADHLKREALSQPTSDTRRAPALSFLPRQTGKAGWTRRLRSRLNGAAFGLDIVFHLDFLQNRLGPGLRPAEVFRSAQPEPATRSQVLLIDDIPFDDQRLNVEIRAEPDASHPDRLQLQATLTASAQLPDNLWLRLTWAGQVHQAQIHRIGRDEGLATIADIPLARLREATGAAADRFALGIEARDAHHDGDPGPDA